MKFGDYVFIKLEYHWVICSWGIVDLI